MGLLPDGLSLFLPSGYRDMVKDLVLGPGDAQQLRRALATNPEDFSSIPGTYMAEGGNPRLEVVL